MTGSPLATTGLRWLRFPAKRRLQADGEFIGRIRSAAASLSCLAHRALVEKVDGLRAAVRAGASTQDHKLLEDMFSLVFVAVRHVVGIELHDVQLIGGRILALDAVAEMQTGEGKTLTAVLPAAVQALAGKGVHIMTVNSYLAQRDFEQLQPVYHLLGLSVGLIRAEATLGEKQAAYDCDVTYGPGCEFGFDYLRDQVAQLTRTKPRLGDQLLARWKNRSAGETPPMQRGHAAAIVDEADSVMIDEATTPLLLALSADVPADNAAVYMAARRTATKLDAGIDFVIDEANGTLELASRGLTQIALSFDQCPRHALTRSWAGYVEQALRAEWLFRRDVHYIVDDDKIRLVDQHTGRIFQDRTWRDGLQQAVQAKEDVTVTKETAGLARIMRQRYFRLYKHLCGMTGTARGAEREFRAVYQRRVVVVPPHRLCRREVPPLRLFADRGTKEDAIIKQVVLLHRRRQPILIGTAAIETSERLSSRLNKLGITHRLLNGKQDAEEAGIVAGAGQLGAVTIATNMAGRGTDIKLGPGVTELGGLCLIATEPQELARTERQLFGRTARQGDPGICLRFAAADDELFTRHAPALSARIKNLAGTHGETTVDITADIANLQRRVERQRAIQRRQLVAHDHWLETLIRDFT